MPVLNTYIWMASPCACPEYIYINVNTYICGLYMGQSWIHLYQYEYIYMWLIHEPVLHTFISM